MTNKQKHFESEREYLISKGLAKAGRGRFSAEAHTELSTARSSGVTFGPRPLPESDGDASGNELPLVTSVAGGSSSSDEGYIFRSPTIAKARVRKEDYAYTVSEDNHLIGHTSCGKCKAKILACLCSGGPRGLAYIKPEQFAYLVDTGGEVV